MRTSLWVVTVALAAVSSWAAGLIAAGKSARPEPHFEATGAASLTPSAAGVPRLDFEELASFVFIPPPFDPSGASAAMAEAQIPASIKRWQGKRVVVTGYMLPSAVRDGLVTEFMLMRNHVAFGNLDAPTINEWVIVRMKQGIRAELKLPIAIAGKLKIGAIWQRGYLVGIYDLEGEWLAAGTP